MEKMPRLGGMPEAIITQRRAERPTEEGAPPYVTCSACAMPEGTVGFKTRRGATPRAKTCPQNRPRRGGGVMTPCCGALGGKIMIIMIIMISVFFQNLMEKRGGIPPSPPLCVPRMSCRGACREENYDNYDICLFSESHGNGRTDNAADGINNARPRQRHQQRRATDAQRRSHGINNNPAATATSGRYAGGHRRHQDPSRGNTPRQQTKQTKQNNRDKQ